MRKKSIKVNTENISKRIFIQKLAQKTGHDIEVVEEVFLDTLDLIVEELNAGNRLEFRGAFILGTKIQEERTAQNPLTLDKVTIPARRTVYFKKGNRLKNIE